LIPEGSLPLMMSRADSIDIDSQADLLLAEQSLLARKSTKPAATQDH
jgi:CMP-N-acetylneuraminic acid synthetase